MNKQREIIYGERKKVLMGENLKEYILHMAQELADHEVNAVVVESKFPEEWDFSRLNKKLKEICPRFKGLSYDDEEIAAMDENWLQDDVNEAFSKLYDEKEAEIGIEQI